MTALRLRAVASHCESDDGLVEAKVEDIKHGIQLRGGVRWQRKSEVNFRTLRICRAAAHSR